jgi:hypothetical protein
MTNNPPTPFERVSVDINRNRKISLINYAAKRRMSVSAVVRKLLDMLIAGEIKLG